MKIRNTLANFAAYLALILVSTATVRAAVIVTGTDGECTNRSGSGHATTTLFFGKDIQTVIATNNEFQKVGGSEKIVISN